MYEASMVTAVPFVSPAQGAGRCSEQVAMNFSCHIQRSQSADVRLSFHKINYSDGTPEWPIPYILMPRRYLKFGHLLLSGLSLPL
jgi:hypothetical protein